MLFVIRSDRCFNVFTTKQKVAEKYLHTKKINNPDFVVNGVSSNVLTILLPKQHTMRNPNILVAKINGRDYMEQAGIGDEIILE